MLNTAQLNDALAANYLLVSVEVRTWAGTKTDKAASDEVTANKGAVHGAARVVKSLLASASSELDACKKAGNALRCFVYENTLPWSRSSEGAKRGDRLIASARTIDFLRDVNGYKQTFDAAVQSLVSMWPTRVQEALRNLGGMADPTEYPSASDIAGYFGCTVDLHPIPSVQDFERVNVAAGVAEALGNAHEAAAQRCIQNAVDELRGRFVTELERWERQMTKAGAGEKTRLYDTLVTNMQGLVQMAREMNVSGNPKLAELADRIENRLLQMPVEAYKGDPQRAQAAAGHARDLKAEAAIDDVWEQI